MLPRTWLGVASDSADTEDTAHSSAEKKHGSESTTETILGLLSHVSGHHLHQYNSDKAKRNCSLTLGNKLDERDEYLVVKSQRMGHLMEPPAAILQRVQLVGLASGTSDESTPPYPKNTSN